MRILVVALSHIGDSILAEPSYAELRRRRPAAEVDVLVKAPVDQVVRFYPHFDHAYLLDAWWTGKTPSSLASLTSVASAGLRMILKPYDACWVPHPHPLSNLVARLSRATRRVGLCDRWDWLLTQTVEARGSVHARDRIARGLGAFLGEEVRAGAPRYWPDPAAKARARAKAGRVFDSADAWLAIHPGAGGPKKRWPAPCFGELGRAACRRLGCRVVVLGGRGEEPLAQEVADRVGNAAENLAGRLDYHEMAAVMGRCFAGVFNDSGPMHLAAAVGLPLVAVFVSTDPAQWGPVGAPGKTKVLLAPSGSRDAGRVVAEALAQIEGYLRGGRGNHA